MNETFGIRSEERRGDRRFAFLEGGPIEGTPKRLLHLPPLRGISQREVKEEGSDLRHDLTPVLTRDLRRRGQRDVVGEAWEDEGPGGMGSSTEVIATSNTRVPSTPRPVTREHGPGRARSINASTGHPARVNPVSRYRDSPKAVPSRRPGARWSIAGRSTKMPAFALPRS